MNDVKPRSWQRQRSFALGGRVVGLGEAIHYLAFKKFNPVTTGLRLEVERCRDKKLSSSEA